MFRKKNSNTRLPSFLEESQFQYDQNAATQLQLFGNIPVGSNVDHVGYMRNDQISPVKFNRPVKRSREVEVASRQQTLQISLNRACQDEGDRSASIPIRNPVSTGLRLSFDDEEQNSCVTYASAIRAAIPILNSISEPLTAELHHQREEIDTYARVQGEQLTKAIKEMKERHLAGVIAAIERWLNMKLKEKDLEIENINRKNIELVERLKEVASEAQTWQYRARDYESIVIALRNSLTNAMEQGGAQHKEGCGDSEVNDAASSQFLDPLLAAPTLRKKLSEKMVCKACRSKEVCMLLLHCRHLCLCEDCEGSVDTCPVCQMKKSASVQVYMF